MTEAHYADVCLRNLKQIYLHWAGISNRFDFSPEMRANKVMNKAGHSMSIIIWQPPQKKIIESLLAILASNNISFKLTISKLFLLIKDSENNSFDFYSHSNLKIRNVTIQKGKKSIE